MGDNSARTIPINNISRTSSQQIASSTPTLSSLITTTIHIRVWCHLSLNRDMTNSTHPQTSTVATRCKSSTKLRVTINSSWCSNNIVSCNMSSKLPSHRRCNAKVALRTEARVIIAGAASILSLTYYLLLRTKHLLWQVILTLVRKLKFKLISSTWYSTRIAGSKGRLLNPFSVWTTESSIDVAYKVPVWCSTKQSRATGSIKSKWTQGSWIRKTIHPCLTKPASHIKLMPIRLCFEQSALMIFKVLITIAINRKKSVSQLVIHQKRGL